jgi:acyl-CoA reductase-like NAD-dependent aldehyde dehydrogenase
MAAFDEEIFGPVFSVIKANDEAEALSLANQTEFGPKLYRCKTNYCP